MVDSVGIDIAEVTRVQESLDRYGDRFLKKILSLDELQIFDKRFDKPIFLAGRFAAKEAVIKALGLYLSDKPPMSDINIIYNDRGMPEVSFPTDLATKLSHIEFKISISHDKNYAIAIAITMEKK